MRVLVTGSRTWGEADAIHATLDRYHAERGPITTLVHGGAAGVDMMADAWAATRRVAREVHRPDWAGLGKRAGMIRNAEMVAKGADLCVAFIRDGSSGASRCVEMARRAGIPAHVYEWADAS